MGKNNQSFASLHLEAVCMTGNELNFELQYLYEYAFK